MRARRTPKQDTASDQAQMGLDAEEVSKFNRMAADWWNPNGVMKPLHKLNPLRVEFIRDKAAEVFSRDIRALPAFDGLTHCDIGCGAGLLTEPMARLGFAVTGLDPAPDNIAMAKAHAAGAGLSIDYRQERVEALAAAGEKFDLVTAMEVVEHVPDVPAFLKAAAALVKPGGLFVGSTINRTKRAYLLAIIGAEYVLRWLPKGTHDWNRFVTPAEFADALAAGGLEPQPPTGTFYDPLGDRFVLSGDTAVNYMVWAVRG
jgi:2-polyprenyl-6-hydroxyphenyl methylase / 3-demethylubiquinone-9 3-methyltransferase